MKTVFGILNDDGSEKQVFCAALIRSNATDLPKAAADALGKLVEEIADVNVAAEAVRVKLGISCDTIAEVEDAKIERWRRRLT